MDKYARVLITIFFLCLTSIIYNFYALNKLDQKINKLNLDKPKITLENTPRPSPTPKPDLKSSTTESDLKSEILIIKAELRAIREMLSASTIINP